VFLVAENHFCLEELSSPLDDDLARPVDQDLRDVRLAEQYSDGPKTPQLVERTVDRIGSFMVAQRTAIVLRRFIDQPFEPEPQLTFAEPICLGRRYRSKKPLAQVLCCLGMVAILSVK
jgi:hypothetical protein